MASKADMLAKLRSNLNRKESNYSGNSYPFWEIPFDSKATVRFLPDLNDDNPFGFYVIKHTHTLIINGEKKTVPCLKMYGEDCPICNLSREYYKIEGKTSVNGKKYYRSLTHMVQALIIEDPLSDPNDAEKNNVGKVMTLSLGKQLFDIIRESTTALIAEDEVPTDYKEGYNFIIKRTQNGEYATYAVGSGYARKSSALDDETIERIQGQMVNLSTLLPANPGLDKVEELLAASLNGGTVSDKTDDKEDDEPPVRTAKTTTKAKAKAAPVTTDEDEDDEPPVRTAKTTAAKATSAVTDSSDDDDELDEEVAAIMRRRANRAEG